MARDKIHLLRCASPHRIDLFRPVFKRRADGAVEVRGGAHCDTRLNGLDHYLPCELWVIEPDRLDAITGLVRDIERAHSQAAGHDEFALARARDSVGVHLAEELSRALKGSITLEQWIAQRGLPE